MSRNKNSIYISAQRLTTFDLVISSVSPSVVKPIATQQEIRVVYKHNQYVGAGENLTITLDPPVNARFIGMAKDYKSYIQFCEFQVFGNRKQNRPAKKLYLCPLVLPSECQNTAPAAATNLIRQSLALAPTPWYSPTKPWWANDGVLDPRYGENSCFHSDGPYQSWWMAEMNAIYEVRSIRIVNRDTEGTPCWQHH